MTRDPEREGFTDRETDSDNQKLSLTKIRRSKMSCNKRESEKQKNGKIQRQLMTDKEVEIETRRGSLR